MNSSSNGMIQYLKNKKIRKKKRIIYLICITVVFILCIFACNAIFNLDFLEPGVSETQKSYTTAQGDMFLVHFITERWVDIDTTATIKIQDLNQSIGTFFFEGEPEEMQIETVIHNPPDICYRLHVAGKYEYYIFKTHDQEFIGIGTDDVKCQNDNQIEKYPAKKQRAIHVIRKRYNLE